MVESTGVEAPANVVERNIILMERVTRYILSDPHVLDRLPDDFEVVILPEDDPEMRRHNLELLDIYGSEGKPIVFVRLVVGSKTDGAHSEPRLYVPLSG